MMLVERSYRYIIEQTKETEECYLMVVRDMTEVFSRLLPIHLEGPVDMYQCRISRHRMLCCAGTDHCTGRHLLG